MISEDILSQFRTGDTEGSCKSFWGFSYSRLQKQTLGDGVLDSLTVVYGRSSPLFFFFLVRNIFLKKKNPSAFHLGLRNSEQRAGRGAGG